jgi:hypothetical protein
MLCHGQSRGIAAKALLEAGFQLIGIQSLSQYFRYAKQQCLKAWGTQQRHNVVLFRSFARVFILAHVGVEQRSYGVKTLILALTARHINYVLSSFAVGILDADRNP